MTEIRAEVLMVEPSALTLNYLTISLTEISCQHHAIFMVLSSAVVASVNIEAIARDLDFQTLQQNLLNITYCNIELELVS